MIRQPVLICVIVAFTSCEGMAQEGSLALGPANSADAAPSAPFRTKYAYFEPASFGELPGWQDDTLADAWPAFRQSCAALRRKNAWDQPCTRSRGLDGSDEQALRHFFEQEFRLYQIYNTDRVPAGVITGYYEPLLNGSLRYGAPYVYPVHGVPDDMLYLDSRTLPSRRNEAEIRVRVERREVVPLHPHNLASPGSYKLEIAGIAPDIRTRRLRLRIDGDRVVPYFSRQEIESGRMLNASVIVWVDNPATLYSMQIQGSGKVRLPSGEIIRVAYGEQNGHPFSPSLAALPQIVNNKGKRQTIATRGLGPALAQDEDEPANILEQAMGPSADDDLPVTRGVRKAPRQASSASEVDLMIEALLASGQTKAAASQKNFPPRIAPALSDGAQNGKPEPHAAQQKRRERFEAHPLISAPTASQAPNAGANSDPSYVFFRPIPNNDGGPIGALGVPLTAGRSVAVDPRTTPLGFPVFISTQQSGSALNRLMLAQDTGGAIRGAVRADYFWGFGAKAFVQASRMKEDGRMWLLMPKTLKIPAPASNVMVRGIGGPNQEAEPSECVVPDPELCVE